MIANTNQFIFNEVTNMRVFLHENFYSNEEILQEICNELSQNFNLFTIEYDMFKKTIQLKIKKTNMKKIDDKQLSSYYYQVINAILVNYFIKKYNHIAGLLLSCKDKYNLTGNEVNYLRNPSVIYNFYYITLISDNIITIHL